MRPPAIVLTFQAACIFFNLLDPSRIALGSDVTAAKDNEEITSSQHIEMASAQMSVTELLNGLGSGVVVAAHEAGSKEAILEPKDITKAVKDIAISKEVVLTKRGHDETRLFAAAVIRHMHRMAGQWEVSAHEERTIIRQKSRGRKRVERVFVTVEGITPDLVKSLPIVFASGPEFLEALFMVMAVMKSAALEKDVKKLLDFVPLMNAWTIVARHEMAYFAYVTYPFKNLLSALAGLTASKAQTDHLEKIKKLQMDVHKKYPGIDKEDIEIQLDLDQPMEKAAFEALLEKGIPLVNYHRHGSFFQTALQSKGSFFQAVEKDDASAADLTQSMLYRAIGVFFQHSKVEDIKRFLSVQFWEDEEQATKTMEEVLARTNHYVSTAFLHISDSLNTEVSAEELTAELNDQFATAETEAKGVSDDQKSRIMASGKSFVEFVATKSPEALGVLIGEHKSKSHPWLKHLVFLHEEITALCSSKPTYCKILLRELHKLHPSMKNALAVEEFKIMLRAILAASGVINKDLLLKTMVKELHVVGSQLKVPKPPETKKEEESVKQDVRHKKELEREEVKKEKSEVNQVQEKDEGSVEDGKNGDQTETVVSALPSNGSTPEDDIDKDDNGGNLGGTSFVWNDLKQFLVYAMLRAALHSLTYALTHPAREDKVPAHLISRLSTDCYFLGMHPDVQAKIKKASEGVEEAQQIKRFDKYFAGYVAACCNALAVDVYRRTMKEEGLETPVEENGFEDRLTAGLHAMGTWRNRVIIPELEKKGMKPPDVKEMQFEVIRDSMNKALKSLAGIAMCLNPRCSYATKILTVPLKDLQAFIRNFSFDEGPTAPLGILANSLCYAYYLNEGMITLLSGTAEDTTPYAIDHDIDSLPQNSVIEQNPIEYYPVCLRLMKTLTANDYGTWLEPPFAKILSACQVVVAKAPELEKTQKGFTKLKACVQKAQRDVTEQFSFIPQMLHFDMQAGVCDFLGLKKLKRKYDLVIRALKEKPEQAELLTKVQEKGKIVSSRLLVVSCLLDKKALRTLSKHIRLAIDGMGRPDEDKAKLEANIKRVLMYEDVAKECNATDELEIIKKLKEREAAHKEADAAEAVAEGTESEDETKDAHDDADEGDDKD